MHNCCIDERIYPRAYNKYLEESFVARRGKRRSHKARSDAAGSLLAEPEVGRPRDRDIGDSQIAWRWLHCCPDVSVYIYVYRRYTQGDATKIRARLGNQNTETPCINIARPLLLYSVRTQPFFPPLPRIRKWREGGRRGGNDRRTGRGLIRFRERLVHRRGQTVYSYSSVSRASPQDQPEEPDRPDSCPGVNFVTCSAAAADLPRSPVWMYPPGTD